MRTSELLSREPLSVAKGYYTSSDWLAGVIGMRPM